MPCALSVCVSACIFVRQLWHAITLLPLPNDRVVNSNSSICVVTIARIVREVRYVLVTIPLNTHGLASSDKLKTQHEQINTELDQEYDKTFSDNGTPQTLTKTISNEQLDNKNK
eukprot:744335-Amphidinium_carterae.1